ncbi:MAG: NTPase [Dehalococcoidales bacterium]|jgi:nucleoside-triphosphatase|nr:NTPase [Dehalococcoidales bacterium]
MHSAYLLTGKPGTGKTSLIRQVVNDLKDKADGFYTEEIRIGGIRQGFRLVTLSGESAILAHVDIKSPFKVSKYGVDISALEDVGIPALQRALTKGKVVVIDEIGKMEIFSDKFRQIVQEILESQQKVLGTIMLKPDPWADIIKQKPQVKLLFVTRNNHDEILGEIRQWLALNK